MPSQEELARIIQEMRQQGLTRDEILETLEDMGVPRDVILAALGGAGESSSHSFSQPVSPPQNVSEQTAKATSTPSQRSGDIIPVSQAPEKDVLSELMSTDSTGSLPTPAPQDHPAAQPPAPPQAPSKQDFSANVATPPILDEEVVASERLDEIHQKVDALHRAISSSGNLREDVVEIKEMLHELKSDIHDIRSMFSAIQHLLQQILETDRSILVDLYEKSKK